MSDRGTAFTSKNIDYCKDEEIEHIASDGNSSWKRTG